MKREGRRARGGEGRGGEKEEGGGKVRVNREWGEERRVLGGVIDYITCNRSRTCVRELRRQSPWVCAR